MPSLFASLAFHRAMTRKGIVLGDDRSLAPGSSSSSSTKGIGKGEGKFVIKEKWVPPADSAEEGLKKEGKRKEDEKEKYEGRLVESEGKKV